MEERDVQIRGYKIRLPLDVYVVASANPEDYTNRGRIITPLKDRVGSEIRTHYPRTVEYEIQIMESESNHFITEGMEIIFPQFMKEVIAEITQLARSSNDISQRSGVSVRVSVTNFENVLSNASRRALRLKERQIAPRISDLPAIMASTCGKIELDTVGDVSEERIVQKLINGAILEVFGEYFEMREFEQLVAGFERGLNVQVGDDLPSMEYVNQLAKVGGLSKAVDKLNRYNMASGVMDDLREKLEEIKSLEREGIQRRIDGEQSQPGESSQSSQPSDQQQSPGSQQETDQSQHEGFEQEGQQGKSSNQQGQSVEGDDDLTPEQKRKMLEMIAKRKQDYLDKLPGDVPGQIKGLSEYDFMDDQAREKFKELMDSLQQQMMQQFFQGMQQSLQNMTPEDIAKMREMIRDLNKMLRERQEGKEPDFDAFMQKHGEYFPGVNSLDDLIEQMQQQMAAMQGIMDNLSPEQRQELQDLMEQLMGDDRIRVDLMELAQNLEAVAPMEGMRTRFNFRGNESLPFNEAMRMMSRLQQMEGLEDQFNEARRMDNLEAIDSEKVKELLGDDEYQSVEQLKELMKMLEEAGYIQKRGNRWELTARGIRKIGQKALQDIFNKLKRDGFGRHVSPFR